MKKQLIIIGVTLTLLSVGLSGCTEQKGTTNINSNLFNGNQTNTPPNEKNENPPSDPTPPLTGIPDPYFSSKSITHYQYTPEGAMTGLYTGTNVKNKGSSGDVFYICKNGGE